MKKTLFTLSLLAASTASIALADASDVVAEYPGLVYADEFDEYSGLTSTSTINASGTTIDLSAYDLNTTNGFTISINTALTSTSYSSWAHVLQLGFDGWVNPTENANFANGPSISWQGWSDSTIDLGINPGIFENSSTLVADCNVAVSTAVNVILTVKDTTWTLSIYDANGDCLATTEATYDYSATSPISDLDWIAIGGTTAGSTEGSTYNKAADTVDNIAVFNYVLSDVEQVELSQSTLSGEGVIPEPSTATLSLLALAGLCVRRRRK